MATLPAEIEAGEGQGLPAREVIEYIEIPFHRPLLTLVPFVLGTVIALFAYFFAPKWFTSSTVILVQSEKVPETLLDKKGTLPERTISGLRVVKQEILSRTRLERVIKELEPYPEFTGRRAVSYIVEYMRNSIAITVRGDDAFQVSYTHKSPYLAMAVTNRLATLFIEEASQARELQVSSAFQFIQGQVEEARRDLASKEEALRLFKEQHMGTLPEELATNLSTLQRLQLEQQSLNESLRGAEERRLVLEKGLAEEVRRGPDIIGGGGGGGQVMGPRGELARVVTELAALRARYTEEHPEVRRLTARVAGLEKQVAEEEASSGSDGPLRLHPGERLSKVAQSIKGQLDETKLEILSVKAKLLNADARIQDLDRRVAETPKVEQDLKELTRDYDKLKENYSALLGRKMSTEMAESLEKQWRSMRFYMLDPAYLPDRPSAPMLGMFIGVGVGLGVFIGLGLAVAAELLDHSVKNGRELEALLAQPLLLTIPHISTRRARRRRLLPEASHV